MAADRLLDKQLRRLYSKGSGAWKTWKAGDEQDAFLTGHHYKGDIKVSTKCRKHCGLAACLQLAPSAPPSIEIGRAHNGLV